MWVSDCRINFDHLLWSFIRVLGGFVGKIQDCTDAFRSVQQNDGTELVWLEVYFVRNTVSFWDSEQYPLAWIVTAWHTFLLLSRTATHFPPTTWRKYCLWSFEQFSMVIGFSRNFLYNVFIKNFSNISTALVRRLTLSWYSLIPLKVSYCLT